jgi:hypothetical protein
MSFLTPLDKCVGLAKAALLQSGGGGFGGGSGAATAGLGGMLAATGYASGFGGMLGGGFGSAPAAGSGSGGLAATGAGSTGNDASGEGGGAERGKWEGGRRRFTQCESVAGSWLFLTHAQFGKTVLAWSLGSSRQPPLHQHPDCASIPTQPFSIRPLCFVGVVMVCV